MRNLLAVIGLLVVILLGVGWKLDWYRTSSVDGKFGVEFDTHKISQDTKSGLKTAKDKIDQFLDDKNAPKPAEAKTPAKDAPPGPQTSNSLFRPQTDAPQWRPTGWFSR